jgi:hypothetical protein
VAVLVAKSMFEACNFPSLQRISAAWAVKGAAIWHLRALAADMGWRVLEGDEESIYRYPQHNGVSRILRVALELGEAIEGKLKSTPYAPDIY